MILVPASSKTGVTTYADPNQNSSKVYPNPSYDKVHIQLLSSEIISQVEFFDIMGRKYFPLYHLDGNIVTIDAHDLLDGIYLTRVACMDSSIFKFPFIVHH